MRPSDEHQHRSKRPNLFSSSRGKGGADDNILARLERMPGDASGAPAQRARKLILGGGVLVAAVLIGALAMLSRDNGALRPMQVSAPPLAASKPAPSALDDVRATIFDELPADAPTQAAPAAAGSTPALPTEIAHSPSVIRTDSAAHAVTAQPSPQSTAQSTAQSPAPPARRTGPAAPASVQAPAKPQLATAQAAPPKAPRRGTPVADDPDVAILTAILSQAPRHAADKTADKAVDKHDRKPDADCGARAKPCPSSQF